MSVFIVTSQQPSHKIRPFFFFFCVCVCVWKNLCAYTCTVVTSLFPCTFLAHFFNIFFKICSPKHCLIWRHNLFHFSGHFSIKSIIESLQNLFLFSSYPHQNLGNLYPSQISIFFSQFNLSQQRLFISVFTFISSLYIVEALEFCSSYYYTHLVASFTISLYQLNFDVSSDSDFDAWDTTTSMSPVICEILLSGFTINSALRRRTHLVQSFSVVFLHWFYVFSWTNSNSLPNPSDI